MRVIQAGEILFQATVGIWNVLSKLSFRQSDHPHPRPFSRLREKGALHRINSNFHKLISQHPAALR